QLKVNAHFSLVIASDKFQYLYGAVKRYKIEILYLLSLLFQYLYGAVKRFLQIVGRGGRTSFQYLYG
ncbi:hypothetical protein, partial [Myroides odoratimimus]